MTDLVLDPTRSQVRLQTYAEGLLARLAHDLELACGDLSGTASRAGDGSPTSGTASLHAPLRGITITGVLGKDGRVDAHGLSPSERKDVISKMQHDVFHAGPDAVVGVEVQLEGSSARVRVAPPNGKPIEMAVHAEVRGEGEATRASGAFEISLAAIGSDVVKGPMNAFRVKDKVKVLFDVVFAPTSQPA